MEPCTSMSSSGKYAAAVITGSSLTIIVSIICGILVGTHVAGQRKQDQAELKTETSSRELCMPCLSLADSLTESLNRITEGGVEMCCANNSKLASALMETVMSSTDDQGSLKTFDAGNFSLTKASAHKQLTMATLRSVDELVFLDSENMNLEFEIYSEDPLTEHVKNVEINKYNMGVKQPGMYFIYSSIFFKPDSSLPCKHFKKQTWEHNILLTRNNDKEHSGIIFNTTYTCCDDCVGHKETSYAGGVFRLQRDDRLHVEVSSDGVVSFRKEGSFFGLFMLS